MSKKISVEDAVKNGCAFLQGSLQAVGDARRILEACRSPDFLTDELLRHSVESSVNLSADSARNFSKAVEQAAHREAIRAISQFAGGLRTTLDQASCPPVDVRWFQETAPDCAWNAKADHAGIGRKLALLKAQDLLLELAQAVGDENYDIDGDGHLDASLAQNPLRSGVIPIAPAASEIQLFFDRIQDLFAEFVCFQGVELVKSLMATRDAQQTIEQYECWKQLWRDGKETARYMAHRGRDYTSLSDLRNQRSEDSLVRAPMLPTARVEDQSSRLQLP
jgi:hypothetical protein